MNRSGVVSSGNAVESQMNGFWYTRPKQGASVSSAPRSPLTALPDLKIPGIDKLFYKTTWWVFTNLLKNDFCTPGISCNFCKFANLPCSSRWLWIRKAVLGPIAGIFCNICKFAELTMDKMLPLCLSWSKTCQFALTSSGFLNFCKTSNRELRRRSLFWLKLSFKVLDSSGGNIVVLRTDLLAVEHFLAVLGMLSSSSPNISNGLFMPISFAIRST